MPYSTFIQSLSGFRGNAALYHLSETIPISDERLVLTDYVVVSAIHNELGMETYAFPADPDGKVLSWSELPGSLRNVMSHATVLENMGFPLHNPPDDQ